MRKSSIYGKYLKKKKHKKTERQKLIDACDDVFREIIRLKYKWICQMTGELLDKYTGDVSHIFSRSYLRTRWDETNAVLLKKGKHKFFAHKYPEKFRDWVIARIGQEEFDRLKLRTRVRGTIYTHELKIILVGLKIRLAKLGG